LGGKVPISIGFWHADHSSLELIESSWMVTCKSGSNEKVRTVIPDSIAEALPVEFNNIAVREMEWEKFDALASFAKASMRSKPAMERPHPLLDLFLTLWPANCREQLQELNLAIERDYKSKSKHKHSVRKIKVVKANEFFVFLRIIII
jgi:hypothetical protein